MISAKENYMLAMNHKIPEWVPNQMADIALAGAMFETFENGPLGGGKDDFGIEWHCTQSAGGQAVPAAGQILLEDICDWQDVIKFPDLDQYDWAKMAEDQIGAVNRKVQLVEYASWNAQFLRLTHVMGFENALCAMVIEPEACFDFMSAVTDYKIGIVERAAKYFKPDFFTSFDDTATERSTFMSPSIYRELIKPHHKRLNEAVVGNGIIPIMHTCGKCEEIIPDFIDEGAVAWSSAQPMNNIVEIQKKYGDKITVIGGFDSNGKPGRQEASDEEVAAEVKRCIDTYAPQGSYIFSGFRVMNSPDPMAFLKGLAPINQAVELYGKNFYKEVNHGY